MSYSNFSLISEDKVVGFCHFCVLDPIYCVVQIGQTFVTFKTIKNEIKATKKWNEIFKTTSLILNQLRTHTSFGYIEPNHRVMIRSNSVFNFNEKNPLMGLHTICQSKRNILKPVS